MTLLLIRASMRDLKKDLLTTGVPTPDSRHLMMVFSFNLSPNMYHIYSIWFLKTNGKPKLPPIFGTHWIYTSMMWQDITVGIDLTRLVYVCLSLSFFVCLLLLCVSWYGAIFNLTQNQKFFFRLEFSWNFEISDSRFRYNNLKFWLLDIQKHFIFSGKNINK